MGATCWDCGKYFRSGWGAVNNHQFSTSCAECRWCSDKFDSPRDRLEHEILDHAYCGDCDREFRNVNNARMHLHSRAHGADSIECPLCSKRYTAAAGVVSHLEAGGCPNARHLSRDALYRFVRSRDPHGIISKRLIGWHGESQFEATDRTWNGYGYECYFCHREFNKLHSLNQHLSSPAHQQAYYHCPKSSCRSEFRTLASFVNHLESESCGYMRFSEVQNQAAQMIRGGRLIGY
ncbi:hypothetical protein MAPG_04596 [Magnaporthiopsis poae ATCC 64411]|uniref:C2H2-type domain-containing protein n=1 Tax=Magnaporthiopsis poae (strain ATCC 64411 / 73-15) TaxID=644358 RepID=A0A0C4DX58_MAGP6|nr:hypothetical protein MAPG_04596 [Magnaporthiopsis poae ATCC 64411]